MGRKAIGLAAIAAVLAGAGTVTFTVLDGPWMEPARPAGTTPPPLSPDYPAGQPIDPARIQGGKLTVEVMPSEVTGALELHSAEIVKTAEVLASKQARITGNCPPGAAIRVVEEDGTVLCQKFPRGVVSVTALVGLPRVATTTTAQASVPGGVGRYQTGGEDDFLVVPVNLPDGAIVTGFAYLYWDADARVDGAAYLYRSDDVAMAGVVTQDAASEVRLGSTDAIVARRVDNSGFAYFVYFQLSAEAGPNVMPVAASVSYRLP
jgi:hypothetical protein